jgi:hypothetical protein
MKPVRIIQIVLAALLTGALAACGKVDDTIASAQTSIIRALESKHVYERGNLSDPPPVEINGYFDIVGGAYRYISNEWTDGLERPDRDQAPVIERGDSISFQFDARIFSGNDFGSYRTFYTNVEKRIAEIRSSANNDQFDLRFWPTTPLKIKVGSDPGILKSVQEALISCRAGEGDIVGDEVRIYLTSDLAFGNRAVGIVPANSTVVFEITDIRIIDN